MSMYFAGRRRNCCSRARLGGAGEYILLLAGAPAEVREVSDEEILRLARELAAQGLRSREVAREAAERLRVGRNRVYRLLMAEKE